MKRNDRREQETRVDVVFISFLQTLLTLSMF